MEAQAGNIEFSILGPIGVRRDGRQLRLRGAKTRSLLAFLLLHSNESISRERLIDELWGESPPATAATALRVYVSRLRKLLEPERAPGEPSGLLESGTSGYRLRIEPEQLDLNRFESLLSRGRDELAAGDPAAAASLLADALGLWQGPAFADLAYEAFAQTEASRLEELRLAALEDRVEAELRLGRHGDLIGELEALVAEHPLREHLRSQLMLALYRSGRQAEALEVYQEARRALVDELGIEPGRSLRELEQAILRQDAALEPAPAQPPHRTETRAGVFVGRERELEELLTGLERAQRRRRPPPRRRAWYRQEPSRRGARQPGTRTRSGDAGRALLGGGRRAGLLAVGAGTADGRAESGARAAPRGARARSSGPRPARARAPGSAPGVARSPTAGIGRRPLSPSTLRPRS